MNKKISDIFGYGDEAIFWEESSVFDAQEIRALTMARLHPVGEKPQRKKTVRRISRTLLIAAVLVCLLTVSAFAMGFSIHQRRQEELRQSLLVDENNADSYVEFSLPEETEASEEEPSLTILSAIKNGEFETVYVSISPVTKEDVYESAGRDRFHWSLDGWMTGGIAFPIYDSSKATEDDYVSTESEEPGVYFKHLSPEAWARLMLEESYDEESRSITLEINILLSSHDMSKPQELSIKTMDNTGETVELPDGGTGYVVNDIIDYGTVTLYPIDSACRRINFPEPVEFENTETGGKGRILGADIYPTSIEWIMAHDDSDEIYATGAGAPDLNDGHLRRLQLAWTDTLGRVLCDARLDFENGDSRDIYGYLAVDYINGEVRPILTWKELIDINAIKSITVSGVEIPIT